MIRSLFSLMVFIVLSSAVCAVGLRPAGDVGGIVGQDKGFSVVATGVAGTGYEVYARSNASAVKFSGNNEFVQSVVGPRAVVEVSMRASSSGSYRISYGVRETGSSMFQSVVEDALVFTVVTGSATNTTNNTNTTNGTGGTTPSSSGGGGGGGGGGYVAFVNRTNASVIPPAPNVVDGVPKPPPELERAIEEVRGAGVGGQEVAEQLGLKGAVQTGLSSSTSTNVGREWGLLAIVAGVVMIIVQGVLVVTIWRRRAE